VDHLKAPPGTSIDLCDWSMFCALEFRMNIEAVFFLTDVYCAHSEETDTSRSDSLGCFRDEHVRLHEDAMAPPTVVVPDAIDFAAILALVSI